MYKGVSHFVISVLVAEEVGGEVIGAAELADGRAGLAAQAAAGVAARQAPRAAGRAGRAGARLAAAPRTRAVRT